jgi:hypothetical protein
MLYILEYMKEIMKRKNSKKSGAHTAKAVCIHTAKEAHLVILCSCGIELQRTTKASFTVRVCGAAHGKGMRTATHDAARQWISARQRWMAHGNSVRAWQSLCQTILEKRTVNKPLPSQMLPSGLCRAKYALCRANWPHGKARLCSSVWGASVA